MIETLAARRTAAAVLIAAGLLTGAAACGGSKKPSQPTGPVQTVATSYPKVTSTKAQQLERTLPTLGGVQSVTYYPKTHVLQVYFKDATAAQRLQVHNLVTQR